MEIHILLQGRSYRGVQVDETTDMTNNRQRTNFIIQKKLKK